MLQSTVSRHLLPLSQSHTKVLAYISYAMAFTHSSGTCITNFLISGGKMNSRRQGLSRVISRYGFAQKDGEAPEVLVLFVTSIENTDTTGAFPDF